MVRANSGYHLFYSGNWWELATAAVGYGRCKGPLSQCTKITTEGPWLQQDDVRAGPAGESFFTTPSGDRFVAYHAWDDAVGYINEGRRSLWVQSVTFPATGAPVLGE